MSRYVTKDSGKRIHYKSGMMRDADPTKARFDLIIPLDVPYEDQILTRFAELMRRGAEKYSARNWEKADSQTELDRFKESAMRHIFQWFCGETDEDHAAGVLFNIMGYETVKYKLYNNKKAKK